MWGPRGGWGARTGVEDLDADFVRAGRGDFDLLELERLASGPADGGLALDGLSSGVRHGGRRMGAFRGPGGLCEG